MNNKQNAKYAFYYLLSLVALIFVAVSVGMIVYSIIDINVPDALNSYFTNHDGQLKFGISALMIATPIYYIISGLIFKGLKKEEMEKESGIRRWLTYFIILVSSVIILGTLVGTINNFLSGELTSRFILKAITIFLISASVFSFYFYDIKREDVLKKDLVIRLFFFISLALIIAAFISAFFFVESPKTARARRLDDIVVSNISSLESMVNSYYERYKKLPDNLEAVKGEKDMYYNAASFVDPETNQAIVYQKLNDKDFQFCATFRTDSTKPENGRDAKMYAMPTGLGANDHAAGYQCIKGNLWSVVKAEPTIKEIATSTAQ